MSRVRIQIAEGMPKGKMADETPGDSTMSFGELAAMEAEAERLPVSMGPLLEVGCYQGRSSVILAQVSHLTIVDWFGGNVELAPPDRRDHTGWDPTYQKAHLYANIDKCGVADKVSIFAGSSFDILPTMHGPFRVILIDADKREESVLKDIREAWGLLAPGGTLFLDDWSAPTFDEPAYTVKRAWERFEKEQGFDLDVDILGFEPPDFKTAEKLARIRKP